MTQPRESPDQVSFSTRKPALRSGLLGLGFLALTIWVKLRFLATRLLETGPPWMKTDFVSTPSAPFDAVRLNALGTIHRIPIYAR